MWIASWTVKVSNMYFQIGSHLSKICLVITIYSIRKGWVFIEVFEFYILQPTLVEREVLHQVWYKNKLNVENI